MSREFNIGDIAHLNCKKKVRGILKEGNYKNFITNIYDKVEIVSFLRADVKTTGGFVYGGKIENKGKVYTIENIPQNAFVSKTSWKMLEEQNRKIEELLSE